MDVVNVEPNRGPVLASREPATRLDAGGSIEEASFIGPEGRAMFAFLHLPDGAPVLGGLVVCSPMDAETLRHYRKEVLLGRMLAPRGVAVLRFHYRGAGNSDGDEHNYDNLPMLLDGRGGGTIRPGRHVRYAGDVPLTNLWLALLDRMGATVPALGDSTGRLPSLS